MPVEATDTIYEGGLTQPTSVATHEDPDKQCKQHFCCLHYAYIEPQLQIKRVQMTVATNVPSVSGQFLHALLTRH